MLDRLRRDEHRLFNVHCRTQQRIIIKKGGMLLYLTQKVECTQSNKKMETWLKKMKWILGDNCLT